MENEKRMVGDYTVLCAVNIGSREIILAENEQDSSGERFLCCYGERNDIFEKFTECAVGDDYIDAALFFAERIKKDAEQFRAEVEKLDIPVTVITQVDCIPDHYKNDINGKIIAINPAVLKPEYQRADRQLYLVTGGFGASANARGSAVFCRNLYDGKDTRYERKLVPNLRVCDMNRIAYQQLLNDYAEFHERQTTMDFHHQLKGAILDAVDEGLIERDPTRKAIIKGKPPVAKKIKYLNQFELHTLLISLDLKDKVNWDYFILLVAKTGMRFSEALALTPKDFDFAHQTLSISKTWDYKGKGGFQPTKNKSSVRKIQIDWQTVIQFSELVKHLPEDKPIFVNSTVYNSTVNDILGRHCKACNIPVISIHGLRHTHASLLLFTGVSIASVARRLGHSSMTTTQKTYLHIIQELENKDIDLVMRSLSGLS